MPKIDALHTDELEIVLQITKSHLNGEITIEAMYEIVRSLRKSKAPKKQDDTAEVDHAHDNVLIGDFFASADLSVRVKKCLENTGIRTVGELLALRASELGRLKNFGLTSMVQLRGELKKLYGRDIKN